MAGNQPEDEVRFPYVHQGWRQVTMLHWRYDPDEIARRLPPGLVPDIVDGSAWVSLTPFRVEGFRPGGLPVLPPVATFCETNLRTYVRHEQNGTDGIFFLSLDVTSVLNVAGGRVIAVPYFFARMSVSGEDDGVVRYRARRIVGPAAHHDIAVRPLGDGPVSEVEELLMGRWRAFTRCFGRLVQVSVHHEPWPIQRAELVNLDETVIAAARLTRPAAAPLVNFSAGVDTRLGRPRHA
jgi:uncharacterized protein YqjF (DUF2071 family)